MHYHQPHLPSLHLPFFYSPFTSHFLFVTSLLTPQLPYYVLCSFTSLTFLPPPFTHPLPTSPLSLSPPFFYPHISSSYFPLKRSWQPLISSPSPSLTWFYFFNLFMPLPNIIFNHSHFPIRLTLSPVSSFSLPTSPLYTFPSRTYAVSLLLLYQPQVLSRLLSVTLFLLLYRHSLPWSTPHHIFH